MRSIKTRGIVIKRMNYGEADRILTVFTERLGKVKVLAKGIRKISSRMAGNLEPYNLLNLELREGKTFFTVTSAEITECLDCDKKLSISTQAVYIAEIIDKVMEEEQRNAEVFGVFADCLRVIGYGLPDELVLRFFELKVLGQAGFMPDFFHCAKCKARLQPGGNFVTREGELQCTGCADAMAENMPDNVIKILRLLQQHSVNVCQQIKCSDDQLLVMDKYIDQLLQNALERELKSKKYL